VTVVEWAHGLLEVLRSWGIDPSDWLKLCDYLQQKLFQVSDQTSELGFLWHRSGGLWPEGSESWALNSYGCLLAQRGFVEQAKRCFERAQQISIPEFQTVPASYSSVLVAYHCRSLTSKRLTYLQKLR
jgi:hypothetical protein